MTNEAPADVTREEMLAMAVRARKRALMWNERAQNESDGTGLRHEEIDAP